MKYVCVPCGRIRVVLVRCDELILFSIFGCCCCGFYVDNESLMILVEVVSVGELF